PVVRQQLSLARDPSAPNPDSPLLQTHRAAAAPARRERERLCSPATDSGI
ncbi:unnamed protein product, partial [Urochloa humidicola]